MGFSSVSVLFTGVFICCHYVWHPVCCFDFISTEFIGCQPQLLLERLLVNLGVQCGNVNGGQIHGHEGRVHGARYKVETRCGPGVDSKNLCDEFKFRAPESAKAA